MAYSRDWPAPALGNFETLSAAPFGHFPDILIKPPCTLSVYVPFHSRVNSAILTVTLVTTTTPANLSKYAKMVQSAIYQTTPPTVIAIMASPENPAKLQSTHARTWLARTLVTTMPTMKVIVLVQKALMWVKTV